MRDQLFFDGPERSRKLSRFWVLLILAAVIAGAGIVGDSTATVIGAMIVAPLMTPILGTSLAAVLADRSNLVRCVTLVVGGAAAVVGVGALVGALVPYDLTLGNAQIAGRVSPGLIDLVAALATGAVGSVALLRSDISDTLPGVAIAISLVPPLAVVGLTFDAGHTDQAAGALLLFVTNVTAILVTGIAVMALYRVTRFARLVSGRGSGGARGTLVVLVALGAIVTVPLALASARVTRQSLDESHVYTAAKAWTKPAGWTVIALASDQTGVTVRVSGPLPEPDVQAFREVLRADGAAGVVVHLQMVPARYVDLKPPQ
jgi:uncharacterized hydrophobic protein (TIGR00271 family)